MDSERMIVTMCGSSKFREEHLREIARLESEGCRVFGLDVYPHADGFNTALTLEDMDRLASIHDFKIMISDAIFVVNVGGYIGHSTALEIAFAEKLGKEIIYLEPPTEKEN